MAKNVDSILPRDGDDHPIQVLAPSSLTNAAVGASSTASALPSGADIVEIGVNTDSWLLFGTSGSTVSNSTGHYMPKGCAIYRVPAGATHLCHIQDSASGRISILKLV